MRKYTKLLFITAASILLSVSFFGAKSIIVKSQALSDNVSLNNVSFVEIEAGNNFSLAIDNNGYLWSWGENSKGQLGDGTNTSSNAPTQIMKGHKFKKVSAGKSIAAAIDVDNKLYTWGNNTLVPTLYSSSSYYKDVLCFEDSFKALTLSSTNIAYGSYTSNSKNPVIQTSNTKLSVPIATTSSTSSSSSSGLSYYYDYKYGTNEVSYNSIKKVTGHTYFGQKSYSYGGYSTVTNNYKTVSNEYFVLQNNGELIYVSNHTFSNSSYADAVYFFDNLSFSSANNVKDVSVGKNNASKSATASYVTNDGSVYFLGSNTSYNLFGNEDSASLVASNNPLQLSFNQKITKISIGYQHVLMLADNGKIYSWGNGANGQLGHGDYSSLTTPQIIQSISNLKSYSFTAFTNEPFEGSVFQYGGSDYAVISNGSKGVLSLDSNDGSFVYTPNNNEYGDDRLEISVSFGGVEFIYEINVYIDRKPIFTGGTASLYLESGQSINGSVPSFDPDGDELVYAINQEPQKGSVSFIDNNGSFTYFSSCDYAGSDSFIISVSDGFCEILFPITVNIESLIAYNDITDIVLDLNHSLSYEGNMHASDMDGDSLTYSVKNNGVKGTVSVDQNGNYQYIANGNEYGEDNFTLKVDDNYSPVEVTYTVHLYAISDNNTSLINKISQGQTFNGSVNVISHGVVPYFVINSNPTKGELTINRDSGEYCYTPHLNTIGDDSFVIGVNYEYGSFEKEIQVYQNSVPNDSEVDVNFITNYGVTYHGTARCLDADEDALTYLVATMPTKGTVELNENNGSFDYIPKEGMGGNDTFSIRVYDGTDEIIVVFNVHIETDVYFNSNELFYTVDKYNSINDTIEAIDIDGDILAYSITNSATKGTVSLTQDGSFTYLANLGAGDDVFIISATDGQSSDYVTVHVHINSNPSFSLDTVSAYVNKGETVSGHVVANDEDGDELTYALFEQANKGVATVSNNGEYTYLANNGQGNDSFIISATDGKNVTYITVNVFINSDPYFEQGSLNINVNAGQSYYGNVTGKDDDGETVSYVLTTEPVNGSVILVSSTGEFVYTASSNNVASSDTFCIGVTDGKQTANITVIAKINKIPVADNVHLSIKQGGNGSGRIIANDYDNDELIYSIYSNPLHGDVEIDGSTGIFVYSTNDHSFSGEDSFVIKVSDGYTSIQVNISVTVIKNEKAISSDINIEPEYDTPYSGKITATDPEGDTLKFTISSQGTKGVATIDENTGEFVYTPNQGSDGHDSFVVTISDGFNNTSIIVNETIKPKPVDNNSWAIPTVSIISGVAALSVTTLSLLLVKALKKKR